MAFYPRKFHPQRRSARSNKANVEGSDLDETIPDAKYHCIGNPNKEGCSLRVIEFFIDYH